MLQAITLTANFLLCAAAGILLLPSLTLFAECAASAIPRRRRNALASSRPRIAVLVPAHDEALHIGETVAAIGAQLKAGDRLLVVADNCSDDTAARARAAGAAVLERADDARRGKGYALAAGVEFLRADPPGVLLMLDADVAPPQEALDRLSRRALAAGRPAQAVYLLQSPADAGTKSMISEFAFLVKNAARPAGLDRLGLPVLLTGTGIALPWDTLKSVSLASGDLVEDMKLGLDLLLAGHPPALCADVVLRGDFPATGPPP